MGLYWLAIREVHGIAGYRRPVRLVLAAIAGLTLIWGTTFFVLYQMYDEAERIEIIEPDLVEGIYTKRQEVLGKLGRPEIQGGAKLLVENVVDSGLEISAVTGSSREEIRKYLKEDFEDFTTYDHIIRGKDVTRGKPDPDPYTLACRRIGIQPFEAIAIENAPLGIESADRAGVFCIAVNTGILESSVLRSAGARVVFDSCADVANNWRQILACLRA